MAKKEANNKKENNKIKKSFFKDFKAELKKVVWSTPKQLINNTTAVVTIVLITAVIVFVLDLTFETINKNGIDKVKSIINSSSENTITDENTVSNETVTTDEEQSETAESNTENQEVLTENEVNEVNEENTENNAE